MATTMETTATTIAQATITTAIIATDITIIITPTIALAHTESIITNTMILLLISQTSSNYGDSINPPPLLLGKSYSISRPSKPESKIISLLEIANSTPHTRKNLEMLSEKIASIKS